MKPTLPALALCLLAAAAHAQNCPTDGEGTVVFRVDPRARFFSLTFASLSGTGGYAIGIGYTPLPEIRLPRTNAGPYRVEMARFVSNVDTPVDVVGTAWVGVPTPSEVCIRNGETSTVDIGLRPHNAAQKLWTAGDAVVVSVAAGSELATGLGTPATVKLNRTPGFTAPRAMAFDAFGNLWVADRTLSRIPESALGSSAPLVPDIVISGPKLDTGVPGPIAMAFDRSGSLWVSVGFSKEVLVYRYDQLTVTGSPEPVHVFTGFDVAVGAIAFDRFGRIFLGYGTKIARYDHLFDPRPRFVIEAQTPGPAVTTLSGIEGFAFDIDSNLWVSYFASNVIARLTPGDHSGGTAPTKVVTPEVQITLPASALLGEIAFDESGSLWTTYSSRKVGRFTPEQLATSGTKAPVVIDSPPDIGTPVSLSFFPGPSRYSVYHSALPPGSARGYPP